MDLDDLLRRYFAVTDLSQVTAEGQAAGVERMLVDLGMEQDPGRRFALWSLLYMLGSAPALDVAFKDPVDRGAARTFMDLMAKGDLGAPT